MVAARTSSKQEEVRAEGMLWTSEICGCERRGRVLHLELTLSTRAPPSLRSVRVHELRCAPVGDGLAALAVDEVGSGGGGGGGGSGGGGGGGTEAGPAGPRTITLAFGTETDVLWPHACTTRIKTVPAPLRPGIVAVPSAPSSSRGGDGSHGVGKVALHEVPKNNQLRFGDLCVEKVQWKARDGQALEGLLYEQRSSPAANPLLVRKTAAASFLCACIPSRFPLTHGPYDAVIT